MNKVFKSKAKIVVIFAVTYFAFALFILPKLPEQFFRDSQIISILLDRLNGIPVNILVNDFPSNFVYSAVVYRLFGFTNLSIEIRGFFVFFLAISIIILTIYPFRITILSLIFFLVSVIPLFVFQSQLTKELFVLPLVFLFIKHSTTTTKKYRTLSLILLLIYFVIFSYFIRNYWIITGCFYCFLRFYYVFFPKHSLFFPILLICLILIFSSNIFLHKYITDFRVQLNFGRDIVDTSSIINNPFINTSLTSDFFNMSLVSFKFIFPFLFLNFQKLYIIIYTSIWTIFHFLIFWKWKYKFKNNTVYRHLFYLLVSFLITQAIFEGDLGSVVKHSTGVIAIYVILFSKK
jgi:hypothetical protein